MSAGGFSNVGYENNNAVVHPIKIQPETETFELEGIANAAATTAIAAGVPSAKVTGSRRSIGVNARLVRFRFVAPDVPPGYLANGVISLPVLTQVAFAAYGKGQTGTYTINGTGYAVEYVGKTPETIV